MTDRPAFLLPLAAPTVADLAELARDTVALLGRLGDRSPRSLCADALTAAGAAAGHRIAVTGHSSAEIAGRLAAHLAGDHVREVSTGFAAPGARPRIALLCSGQGAQFPGMGMDLYRSEPVYRKTFDRCADAAAPYLAMPLVELLDADASAGPGIHRLPHAALTTFAVGCALTALWRDRGVEPDAVLGFSSGEYLAAHVAGALTAEDAIALLAAETTLAEQVGDGAMCVVGAAEKQVLEVLAELGPQASRVGVAAVLSAGDVSLSGSAAELAVVTERLAALGIRTSALPVPQGLHSPLQEPFLDELRAAAAQVPASAPTIPMVSTVTGRPAGQEVLADPAHWSAHQRGPVRFLDGMRTLDALGTTVYIEAGPGRALTGIGPRALAGGGERLWLASIGRSADGAEAMLRALGRLFTAGVPIRL
ncbi:acyltransferase domain-containing protein [Streptomyces sp. NPDC049597]|uniref:acyltransferase domain-containing protein n=1 Tax=Streptomyces sp. NPDC049597 TaxID=3155276 RepID=UPI0034200464